MCISPITLPDIGEVGCRKCWQCERNRVDDLVGRCIAEQKYAAQTFALTLTYGDQQLEKAGKKAHAATLVYKDVQDFLKRLRKAGHEVRYIVAGEYGSRKQRAHWHMILFLRGEKLIDVIEGCI